MSDVFISYAREDKELVKRLHDWLVERERSVWVDWEGIPPSAEWLDEINAAIDGADTYIQILSPDSVASVVCRLELDRAVRNNKRLIAIVLRDVPADTVAESLAEVNWIFLREHDEFDAGAEAIITALETDLDWARVHTRLLVRAVEWNRRARPRALCLRGRELGEHRAWLARIGDKQPRPTELQEQYLTASRKASRRRQAIVTAVLVVILAVGVGLWWQVDRQTAISTAQRIVADADAARIAAPALQSTGLMLAVEGTKRLKALGVTSLSADRALRNAVRRLPRPIVEFVREENLSRSDGWIQAIAFAGNDHLLASYGDGQMVHWREESPSRLLRETWPARPIAVVAAAGGGAMAAVLDRGVAIRLADAADDAHLIEIEENATAIALSPSGELLVTESAGAKAVTVWNVRTATKVGYAKYRDSMEVTVALAISDDGQRVAMIREKRLDMLNRRHVASVLEVASQRRIALVKSDSPIWNIALSSDGARIAVSSGSKVAIVFDVRSRKVMRRIELSSDVAYVGFSPDSTRLATVDAGNLAQVWHIATGIELIRIGRPELKPPLVFSPDGSRLAVHQLPGIIRVYAAQARGEGLTLVHKNPVNAVAISRGRIATASGTVEGPGELALWDAATGDRMKTWPLGIFEMGQRVAFDREGRLLMLGDGTPVSCQGRSRLWDLTADREIASVEHRVCGEPAALSPDGRQLAFVRDQGPTEVLDVATGRTTKLSDEAASILVFDLAGVRLAAAFETGWIRVWTTAEGRLLHESQLSASALAFDPRGERLAATAGDDHVTVWEVGGDRKGRRLTHLGRVLNLAFSPDGALLASGASDGLARLWDFESGAERARLAHAGGVNVVAFNDDGATLATGSDDGTARLWALPGAVEVARFAHGAAVNDLAIARDGRFLVTGGQDGTARRWLLHTDDLLAEACARLADDAEPGGWDDYLHERLTAPLCEPAPVVAGSDLKR